MTDKINFNDLNFDKFKELAKDDSLSMYEKIGFPDSYRQGFELAIFNDIQNKLSNLSLDSQVVIDIGPGCSELPLMLIELCKENEHSLHLIDNKEMLQLLPDGEFIHKIDGIFPQCGKSMMELREKVDIILCYSLLHYIMIDTSFFRFLDSALSLLAPGGQLLIGDIPNISKRKRFFSSSTGVEFHKNFMKTDELPSISFNNIEHDHIDDAVIFSLLMRARAQGFDAYILPQAHGLPMANRREDILIERP